MKQIKSSKCKAITLYDLNTNQNIISNREYLRRC